MAICVRSVDGRSGLQWGRDSSVAEMLRRTPGNVPYRGASMGPRLFSRGNRDQRPGRLRGYGRFNGAATLQSRKCSTLVVVTRKMQGLQWGRDSSVAEIWEGAIATFRLGQLQWGRDSSVAEISGSNALPVMVGVLQWGRDSSVAEIGKPTQSEIACPSFNGAATLQSRKSTTPVPGRPRPEDSMGPRLFSRGNRRRLFSWEALE